MSHLENLLNQYYEWQGYMVRRNVFVGRLSRGGWEGELDIVAYHPETKDLLHLEPSLDAHSWSRREARFEKKFLAGRRYIFDEVLPWLDKDTPLTQRAILISRGRSRTTLVGAELVTIDETVKEIRSKVVAEGRVASGAIPEQFDLLRTIQLIENGYYRRR